MSVKGRGFYGVEALTDLAESSMGQGVGSLVRVLGKHTGPGCPGWEAPPGALWEGAVWAADP